MNYLTFPDSFPGRAEVKGHVFTKLKEEPGKAFLFQVDIPEIGHRHYEVIKYVENRKFGGLVYPKSSYFGKLAWHYPSVERAELKYSEVLEEKIE